MRPVRILAGISILRLPLDEDDGRDSAEFRVQRKKGKKSRYAIRDKVDELVWKRKQHGLAKPSDMMQLRIMSLFETPEDYLDMELAKGLFAPNSMPRDIRSGNKSYHQFKSVLFRMADWMRVDAEQQDRFDPLSMILDDLFLQVVLPNMMANGHWTVDSGRKSVQNVIGDVYLSLIIRFDSIWKTSQQTVLPCRNRLMATHVRGMMEGTSAGSRYGFRELRTFYDEVSHHFGESSKSSENR